MSKVIIKKNELPPASQAGVYTFRVRMVSDDKNTSSHWTPIYNLLIPLNDQDPTKRVQPATMANIYHIKIGIPPAGYPDNYNIYVSWYDPNNLGSYDVYAKWKSGDNWTAWMHMATTSAKNFMLNTPLHLTTVGAPSTYFNMYGIAVTRSNFHKQYNSELALFSTDTMVNGGISLT